ncbi:MAG: HEAT repeat domain-containing protein [Phycisphaeraceae bacterium]|nr:HEAT repeat domain-containing protein [Phycisphaeraceae bacterium]
MWNIQRRSNSPCAMPHSRREGSRLQSGHALVVALVLIGLAGCASAPEPIPEHESPFEIDEARIILDAESRERAREVILSATDHQDSFIRANVMEAAGFLGPRTIPVLQAGLEDSSAVVRFAALATIGRLKIEELGEAARAAYELQQDRERRLVRTYREFSPRWGESERLARLREISAARSVLAAALFAMHQTGEPVSLTPLGRLLAANDPGLRGNVAMLLGFLGDPSAVSLLEEVAQRPVPMAGEDVGNLARVQIAEAMVKLGSIQALDTLRAALYSQSHETRVLAVEAIINVGDRSMEGTLFQFAADRRNNMELRLAAGRGLALWGEPATLDLSLRQATSREPIFRTWAARALGAMEDPRANAHLIGMLDDPDPRVRLTAARAILEARELRAPTGQP